VCVRVCQWRPAVRALIRAHERRPRPRQCETGSLCLPKGINSVTTAASRSPSL
jgi:hypothetical protein